MRKILILLLILFPGIGQSQKINLDFSGGIMLHSKPDQPFNEDQRSLVSYFFSAKGYYKLKKEFELGLGVDAHQLKAKTPLYSIYSSEDYAHGTKVLYSQLALPVYLTAVKRFKTNHYNSNTFTVGLDLGAVFSYGENELDMTTYFAQSGGTSSWAFYPGKVKLPSAFGMMAGLNLNYSVELSKKAWINFGFQPRYYHIMYHFEEGSDMSRHFGRTGGQNLDLKAYPFSMGIRFAL